MTLAMLSGPVDFIVQNKAFIKDLLGPVQFAAGCYGIYHAYSKEQSDPSKTRSETLFKITTLGALILIPFISRPGLAAVKLGMHGVFGQALIESVFGPTTNFVGNRIHPRHVFSILTCVLGIPATIKTLWNRSMQPSDWIVPFVTITSRPVLHWGAILLSGK